MLPFLKEIRKAVKCHFLPIPYRTSEDYPTFFNLPVEVIVNVHHHMEEHFLQQLEK